MATNDTSHEIIIQALVDRIQDLQKTMPGSVGDPWAVVDKLVRRGEVKWICTPGDPLAQRSFMIIGTPSAHPADIGPPTEPMEDLLLKECRERIAEKDKALQEIATAPLQTVAQYRLMASRALAV